MMKAVIRPKGEMRDSKIEWMKMIPNEWTTPKLLYVLRNKISDGPHETPHYVENGIPFISLECLNESKTINFSLCKRFISQEDYNRYSLKTKLEKDDILFSKAASIGKTAIVDERQFMVWSPIAIIKNNARKIDNKFLYYLLNCTELIMSITLNGSMNTQINVGMREIEQVRIPLPTLPEQQIIADYLDEKCGKIDEIIAEAKASIDEYENLRQSIIYEILTKGPDDNVEMKDSGVEWIGKVPSHWMIGKVKYGTTKVGSGKTPKGGAEVYMTSGVMFLRSQNIYNDGLRLDNPYYISEEIDEEMKNTRVQKNDVLLNITGGSIGRCCIFDGSIPNANVNQHVCIIRVNSSVFLPEYMHLFWISPIGQISIKSYQTGGNREGMSAEAIKNTPIPIIPIGEQRRIVDLIKPKIDDFNSLISEKESLINDLEAYKKSLIYEVVTGKRRVV